MTDHIIFDGKRAVASSGWKATAPFRPAQRRIKNAVMCRRDCFTADPATLRRRHAELLAEFDIPLVHELPGVGKIFRITWRCTCNMSAKNRFPLPCPAVVESAENRCGVAVWRTGVGASNHFEAGGFIRSRENLRGRIFSTISCQWRLTITAERSERARLPVPRRIDALAKRGHVRIKSRDPHQHPGILFNTCRTSRTGRSSATQFASPASHASTGAGSVSWPRNQPRCRSQTDEQLDEFVRNHAETAFHRAVPAKWVMTRWQWLTPKAATRAGRPARGGCVNYAANYHRNLNATTIMIGEKIADMIRGKKRCRGARQDILWQMGCQ